MKVELNIDEIHDLHMALSEVIEIFKTDKQHQKEFGNNCSHCEDYRILHNKLVKLCNCIGEEIE